MPRRCWLEFSGLRDFVITGFRYCEVSLSRYYEIALSRYLVISLVAEIVAVVFAAWGELVVLEVGQYLLEG